MGFALWIDEQMAWARGTHEYGPMGVAVISRTDLFGPRDFDPARRAPGPSDPSYVGLFASIGELNHFLERMRARHSGQTSHKRMKQTRTAA